jgi:hypothetical protein
MAEGLREAVARALRDSKDGEGLLLSPGRFWGCVADSEAGDTVEGRALRGHVDEALLRPYHDAAAAGAAGAPRGGEVLADEAGRPGDDDVVGHDVVPPVSSGSTE